MMRLKKLAIGAVCAVIGFSAATMRAGAQTTVLYNDAGMPSPTPQSEGWLSSLAPEGTVVTQGNGTTTFGTTFDTTSTEAIEGGYSNYTVSLSPALVNGAFPTLNPTTGFTVSFDVAINSETHGADDTRAGFDVIVLGSNHLGVELGFWMNDIWAQEYTAPVSPATNGTISPDPAEDYDDLHSGSPDISTSALTQYNLTIQGGNYTLTAGATDPVPLFSGPTHDYSAYQLPPGEPNPYGLSNYIFMGDDTTDAEGSETIAALSVTVPEPATASGLVVLGLGVLGRRRRGDN
jgi:hypothetical protein